MNRRSLVAISIGLTLVVTACHHKKPETAPTPVNSTVAPTAGTTAATTDGTAAALQYRWIEPRRDCCSRRVATMSDRIHFDYNKSDIKPEDTQRLDGKGRCSSSSRRSGSGSPVTADERGSDQYNIALGMRRATAAKNYLVQLGIDASRIDVASLGREVPIDPGHDEAAWAQNRRDEFDIIAGSQSLRAP